MQKKLAVRFGERVRELRSKRGWRQIDLAAHAEISTSHLSEIEWARTEVCLHTIEKLANALEIPVSQLFEPDFPKK